MKTILQNKICRRTRYHKAYTAKELSKSLGVTAQGIHNAMRGLMRMTLSGSYNYRWERNEDGYEKVAYWTMHSI
jgi:predicted transcriptional regulator